MKWMLIVGCFLLACAPDTEIPVDMSEWNCEDDTAQKLVMVTFNDCWLREDDVYGGSGIGDHGGCLEYALNLWCERRDAQPAAPKNWLTPEEMKGMFEKPDLVMQALEDRDEDLPHEWIEQRECRRWRSDARAYFEVKNQLDDRLWDCAVSACNLAGWEDMESNYQDDCTQSYLDGKGQEWLTRKEAAGVRVEAGGDL